MGKHRNQTQNEIFLKFMEENKDIASGYTKRDKVLVASLWEELSQSLNSAGPPTKDANGWKKIWTEWKSEIKKKLAHNRSESRATGGGLFNKFQLTPTEEGIVQMCAINTTVEGVSGISLGTVDDCELALHDDIPTSSKRKLKTPTICSTPKRARPESVAALIEKFLDEDGKRKNELNDKVNHLILIQKEHSSSFRRVYRAIEKNHEAVANSVKELKDEFVSLSSRILKVMQEKNEIKRKQLELELLKFNLQNNNNEKN